jgi:hypothetical protein
MKFWTTAPEAYDYSYTVDTGRRHGNYRLVDITDPERVQYQRERYLSGLHPSIHFQQFTQARQGPQARWSRQQEHP